MQLESRDPEYGDLRSMECEVPEVVVFLKENGCQIFKDLCIDGEVPCHDKCCVENCELDHNNISNLLKYELARNSREVSEEMLLYTSISTGAEESFSNHDCIHDDAKLCDAEKKLLMEDKTVSAHISTEACSSSEKELSDIRNLSNTEQITGPSLSHLFNCEDLRLDQQQNHQEHPKTETMIADTWSAGKEADCRNCNGVDLRSEVELGAQRITDDSGSQPITDESTSEDKRTESTCEAADCMSKVPLLASSSSSRQNENTAGHHRELGSSSFSAASTASGRLTFSGLIPFSDNISLRSNSTASTRSFAFPTLATEWNESPIRMAEVDRKPKRRGCWRMCFTCSNF
ncbi:uncharacterized protein [Coffea arabica]|uniref:Uncharacterized protein n=1 Tax=Coffea arabica TaxID=13443 RepID=A0A6P6XGB7_COFAR|nr:uncharacterized protein LOC113742581 [Coffea arabica]XP_027126249.1 uncharacterized protein LOC113742581 [Coffea arabica]